jgi:hypothetical protein
VLVAVGELGDDPQANRIAERVQDAREVKVITGESMWCEAGRLGEL